MLKHLSIRQKLLGLVALVTTAALLGAFSFHTLHDVESHRRELIETSILVARVVGDYTVPDLAFDDTQAAANSLGKLAAMPAVRSALLFDARGRLFTAWGMPVEPLLATERAPAVRLADDGLHVVEPIVYKGDRYGSIYLVVSTDEMAATIRRDVAVLIAVLAVTLGLSLLVAYRLQRVISGPILELARTTHRVTLTGDTSLRATKRADDEIGALCDGFNDMLDQIQRRERERDAAEHRTQEKTRFLANMSHELRTPLNSIIGFSEILLSRGDHLQARERKFLSNIHISGKHLLTIINDILDLSKVEAGRMELQPEPVSVPVLLEGVITVMKAVADRDGVHFETAVPPDVPVIWADPVKVKQILYNLLSNAVKFSAAGTSKVSRVAVAVHQLDASSSPLGEPTVEVSVRDEGIGIAPDDQLRIFEPFQQVDSTAGRRFGGTGLGLALVKSFAEMHGGAVTVESVLGQGSEFRVLLPVRSAQIRGDAGLVPLPVLVVEDDRAVFERLSPLLEEAGFAPVLAKSGDAALALARSLMPAAVILDLVLPGLVDGWEVLKSLKVEPETASIPIVIYSRQENRELGLALGADDYFLKPMDLQRLVARVGALAARAMRRRPAGPTEVLLVGDDRSVHRLLESGLGNERYELVHAYSIDEGLARARTRPPALVVIDLLMDHAGGLRLALQLRAGAETAAIPLVLVAGHAPSDEERAMLRSKALTLLAPDGGETLSQALQRLLGHAAGDASTAA
ncbi:MAG TPA: response regulator [Thermoanaerobaculia bacterium]|nr:response regulator [Thermoanaerobaculia bacterium]